MPRLAFGILATVAVGLTGSLAAAASPPEILKVTRIIPGPTPFDSFRRPLAVAADTSRGVIVVADTGRQRLVLFDQSGRCRGFIRASDTRAGEFRAVALDPQGRLFVIDAITGRVDVLTSRGTRIASLVPRLPEGVEEGAIPEDVDVGASGRIYMLYGGPRPGLAVIGTDGRTLAVHGFEPEAGLLRSPVALAVDPGETAIAVADPEAEHPVVILNTDGSLRAAYGSHGDGDATFSLASGVCWGPAGSLWVTDTLRHSISVFDRAGAYRGKIGGFGFGPGQFYHPIACTFVGADRLLVLERARARFQVLEVAVPSAPAEGITSSSVVPESLEPFATLIREEW